MEELFNIKAVEFERHKICATGSRGKAVYGQGPRRAELLAISKQ
jgi:hypothetical protein